MQQLALQLSVTPDDGTLIDSFRACTAIDGQGCMLDVRSTSGLEEYTAIWDQCMHDSEGFLLVYSVTSRASFTWIPRFHNQIRRVTGLISDENLPPKADGNELPPLNCPVILVGANIDREREVSTKEGHELAIKLRCDFVEVSVKNCINIGKPFCEIVRLLRRRHIMNTAVRIRRPSMTYKNQRGAISVSNIVRRRVWR
jgi:GTPase KRas protein